MPSVWRVTRQIHSWRANCHDASRSHLLQSSIVHSPNFTRAPRNKTRRFFLLLPTIRLDTSHQTSGTYYTVNLQLRWLSLTLISNNASRWWTRYRRFRSEAISLFKSLSSSTPLFSDSLLLLILHFILVTFLSFLTQLDAD